jgi:aminopeptidase N
MWPQAAEILTVLGRRFGEYPFFEDKYWVVDSPYLGMEHQTLVAYGDNFQDNQWGFDDLLLHETAHEWWGNKITVADWADFWIQEGFGTYAEAVYVNDTLGIDAYLDYAAKFQRGTSNRKPVIRGSALTSAQAYSGDIYVKGAATLHTLRYLLGDEQFFALLHRFATDPAYAYQIVSMDDWTALADEMTGRDLDWFWQRYIYTAKLPRWTLERHGDEATLSWDDPNFTMPLPISIDGEERHLELPNGRVVFEAPAEAEVLVDPKGWVLEASDKKRQANREPKADEARNESSDS